MRSWRRSSVSRTARTCGQCPRLACGEFSARRVVGEAPCCRRCQSAARGVAARLRPVRSLLLSSLSLALLTACGTAPTPATAPGADYTLVLIRTGPRTTPLPKEERGRMFQGHFDNMERLARAGDLLLAGPYGQNRSAPDLRGIFVLVGDQTRARTLAETDPGFQQGEFRFEYHTIRTAARFRELMAAEFARQDAAKASGKQPKPGDGGRAYVLLACANGDAAQRLLAAQPTTLLFARLDGERAFVVLDAKQLTDAQAMLAPHATELGTVTLDEWFATDHLVQFGQPVRG